jgi:invasion protein IalB
MKFAKRSTARAVFALTIGAALVVSAGAAMAQAKPLAGQVSRSPGSTRCRG